MNPTHRDERLSPISIPVLLRAQGSGVDQQAEALYLSRSGAFLRLVNPPPVGTSIELEFRIPITSLVMRARAEVTRVSPTVSPVGIGVRFKQLTSDLVALIHRLTVDAVDLDQYRVEALIGTGATAEVYRAFVVSGPDAGQRVAIKRLRAELAGDEMHLRLLRTEAKVGTAVDHPGLVRLIRAELDRDVPHLVMEHVAGATLREVIDLLASRGQVLSLEVTCYVVREVALALEHVHSVELEAGVGLVHCDVAPTNILISADGDIKLCDFGVACDDGERSRGHLVGKAPYMAPEKLRGRRLTAATDLFALGAILYECLTGVLAFAGDSNAAIYEKILTQPTPSASTVRPEVPNAIDGVIANALAKRREGQVDGTLANWLSSLSNDGDLRRYDRAAQLAGALAPFCGSRHAMRAQLLAAVAALPGSRCSSHDIDRPPAFAGWCGA